MKNVKGNIARLARKMKYASSGVFSDAVVEIRSNTLALIGGCVRLTEYSRERIALEFRDMKLEITGRDLEPESLLNGQKAVKGSICEVRYVDN